MREIFVVEYRKGNQRVRSGSKVKKDGYLFADERAAQEHADFLKGDYNKAMKEMGKDVAANITIVRCTK